MWLIVSSVIIVAIIIIYSFGIFRISVSCWFFTGVWVTASLFKSPGLFSVFRPFSIMPVVWMISTRLPTSKFSSPFSNPLVTVPKVPLTMGIIVTCLFHSFLISRARSRYLSFFSHSFSFILWSAGTVGNFANYHYHYYYYLIQVSSN